MFTPLLRRAFGLLAMLAFVAGAAAGQAAETRTIYLVRHGAYNLDPANSATPVGRLTPLGLAEARLVAARLRGMPLPHLRLVSSTLARAVDTAKEVAALFPGESLSQDPLLCECMPASRDTQVMQGVDATDVESSEKQLQALFAKYFVPADGGPANDVLVCHGNVIRWLVMKALGADTRGWTTLSVAHASLTVIRVHADGRFTVLSVGDTGHLPVNLVSGTARTNPELVLRP